MSLEVRHKFNYGLGQVASGAKDLIMGFFILQLYSITLGLPGKWVGLAAFFALAVDAFTDPFFGHMSDQTHSKKWGRRHGLMLVAILPFCLGLLLVFNPPPALAAMGGVALLAWMVLFDSVTRASLSAFYVPYLALGAEASDDYQERTSIMGWRFLMAYVLIILLLAFFQEFILSDNRDVVGYRWVGVISAIVCGICMLWAALGTRSWIENRQVAPSKTRWYKAFVQMYDALSVKSFRVAVIAFSISAVMTGLFTILFPIVMGGFWGLTQGQVGIIFFSVLCAAPPAFLIAPFLSEKLGKKPSIILVTILYGVFGTLPVFGRLMGIMPENGDPSLMPILWVFFWMTQTFVMCALMLFYSMAADVADDYTFHKGERKEGIILAGLSFGQKFGLGFGMLFAGTAVDIIKYPKGENVDFIPPEVLTKLGIIVGPILLVMILIPAIICCFYPLTRDRHAEVQAAILARDGGLPAE